MKIMLDAGGNFYFRKIQIDHQKLIIIIIIIIPPPKQWTDGSMHYMFKMNTQERHRYQY